MSHRQAAVIVLAAGRSARFRGEGHKLAQPLGDENVLDASLRHAQATGLRVVAVCSSATVDTARRHLGMDDIVLIDEVSEPSGGQPLGGVGHSIAAGVSAAGDADGWLIVPGDMPLISTASMTAVLQALSEHSIAFAQHLGMPGYPVGFEAELYSELVHLRCDEGPRRLMARYPSYGVELADPGVLADIDTVEDLRQVQSGWLEQQRVI